MTIIQVLKTIDRKIFAVLFVAGLVGVIAVLPYMADLLGTVSIGQAPVPDMPWALIVTLALLQNGILLAAVILIGMILSGRVGLQMPLIRAWATAEPPPRLKSIVQAGVLVGAAVGTALVVIEAILFLRHLPPAMHPLFEIPLWKRLLASALYGGVTEELLMRLFLLSLVAWLLGRWWKTADGMPTIAAFWVAILVVAILFGLGHLPATAAIAPLTRTLVLRALVLNGVAGGTFGYLYWRHGLEAAMLGHMSAHLVMQVLGVMLLRSML
jgi:membrane protease YdiL (CAAX protease family)